MGLYHYHNYFCIFFLFYSISNINRMTNQEKVEFMTTFLSWKYAFDVNKRQKCLYLNYGVDNLNMAAPQIRRVILIKN